MRTTLILALLVALLGLSTALPVDSSPVGSSTCSLDKKCVEMKKECNGDFERGCDPKVQLCCAQGLLCYNNKCQANDIGKSCQHDSECKGYAQGNHLSACRDNKCYALYNAGEKCSHNADCFGDMLCVKGTCAGAKLGESCRVPVAQINDAVVGATCEFGLFCKGGAGIDGVCTEAYPVGTPCKGGECHPNLFCDVMNTGTCAARNSLKEGSKCNSPVSCEDGTFCNQGICQVQKSEPKLHKCKHDTDCAKHGGGTCVCDEFVGRSYCTTNNTRADCANLYGLAQNCYVARKCTSDFASFQPGTCPYEKCRANVKALFDCENSFLEDYYGSCYADHLTPKSGAVAAIVVSVLVLLVGGLAVGGVAAFYLIKKRGSYTPVD